MNDCESHPGNEKSFVCSMPTCFKTLCTVCLQQHGGVHMNLPFNPQPLADAVDYCRERMQVHRESIDWELQRITENQYYEQIVKERLATLRSLHKHIRALVRQLFVQYEDAYSQQLSRFAKQVQSNLFELRRELQDKIRDVREISTGLEQRQYHAKLVEYILRNEENVKNEMRAFKDKYAACIESVEAPEPVRLDSQFDEKLQDLIVSSVYIENAPAVRYKSERLRDVSPKLQTFSQQKPTAFFGQAETTPQSSYARSAAPENISSIHSRVRRTTTDLMQQQDYPPEPHASLQGRFATAAEEAAQSQQSSSVVPYTVNARAAPQLKPSLRTEMRENAQDFQVTRPDFFIGETRAFLHYLQQSSWGIGKATLTLNIFDVTVLNPKWKQFKVRATQTLPEDFKSIALPDGQIYIFGGKGDQGKKIWRIENGQQMVLQETGQELQVGRTKFALVSLGQQIYIVGGVGKKQKVVGGQNKAKVLLKQCEVYDTTTNQVSQIASLNELSSHHTCCTFENHYVYKLGGLNSERQLNQVIERYDPQSNEWQLQTIIGHQFLMNCCALQINQEFIVVFGGQDESEKAQRNVSLIEVSEKEHRERSYNRNLLPEGLTFTQCPPFIHKGLIFALAKRARTVGSDDLLALCLEDSSWRILD